PTPSTLHSQNLGPCQRSLHRYDVHNDVNNDIAYTNEAVPIGRLPYALMLTAGNVSDVKAAPALLERAGPMRYLLGDKGYDANSLRKTLRENGTSPVIPGRRNRKRAIRYDKQRYRSRHLIENAFCRIKDFRRVATRYDKLAVNFLSGVALVTALAFWL
ncbi:MAG: IS5 family transposase, partial [Sphingomonadales bacterium]|nr:IS5 family transposase [Sphingomonadales bacterium]